MPQLVTIQSPNAGWQNNLDYNLGIFVQDHWTLDRLTCTGGVRLDILNESTAAFTALPHRWLPNRERSSRRSRSAELEGRQPAYLGRLRSVRQRQDRDEGQRQPRGGAGLDPLRADEQPGRHPRHADAAVSGPTTTTSCRTATSPTARSRTTGDVRRLVRPVVDAGFGSVRSGNPLRRRHHERWGVVRGTGSSPPASSTRSYPASRSVGYFRRIQGNFYVMDNEAYGPPTSPNSVSSCRPIPTRLSGQAVGGFLDPNRDRRPQSVVKGASQFGKQQGHWNGFDVSVDTRPCRTSTFRGASASAR